MEYIREILSIPTCLGDLPWVNNFDEKAIKELGVGVPKTTGADSIWGLWSRMFFYCGERFGIDSSKILSIFV